MKDNRWLKMDWKLGYWIGLTESKTISWKWGIKFNVDIMLLLIALINKIYSIDLMKEAKA